MAFFITLLITAVSVVFCILKLNWDGDLSMLGFPIAAFGSLVSIVMLLSIIWTHCIALDVEIAKMKNEYVGIMHKIEIGLSNYELISEVQEWNDKIIGGKKSQHNFWVGVFVPDIYDQFEIIEYNLIKENK